MAGSHRVHRLGLWLGVLALLSQTAAFLSVMPPARAGNGPFQDLSLFCNIGSQQTGGTATRSGEGNDRDDAPCPVCLVFCHALSQPGGFLPPAADAAPVPKSPGGAGGVPADIALPAVLASSFNCARAPPLPV